MNKNEQPSKDESDVCVQINTTLFCAAQPGRSIIMITTIKITTTKIVII